MPRQSNKKAKLTETEKEIRRLIALGYTNDDIAKATGLTSTAVKARLQRVYERLWLANRAALVALRIR